MVLYRRSSVCLLPALLVALGVTALAQPEVPVVSTQVLFESGEFDAVLARVADGAEPAPEDISSPA